MLHIDAENNVINNHNPLREILGLFYIVVSQLELIFGMKAIILKIAVE